jgi:4-hydroxybenzoate polyprenyltransferase
MNLKALITLVRPHQWLKNLMLFFPVFLGGKLTGFSVLFLGLIPFGAFCLASSATYILNDIIDAPIDALHPKKRNRPIAAGVISVRQGISLALLLEGVALLLAFQVQGAFLWVLIGYSILSTLYTFWLKNIAIVDLFCIAIFFLLRLEAGGQAFDIAISAWLFLCVFLMALFLSTGKRLSEKNRLGAYSADHRKSLHDYPEGLLDGIMYMTGGTVLVTYSLYVINRHGMIYTVPLCCFVLIRYMYRVKTGLGGDPTYALLQDRFLFCVGGLWVLMVGYWTYWI